MIRLDNGGVSAGGGTSSPASFDTGTIIGIAPIQTSNLAYAVGGTINISINTANIPVYVGATSALLLGTFALSSNMVMAGNLSANVFTVGSLNVNTNNLIPYIGATSDVVLGAKALSSNLIMAGNLSANVASIGILTGAVTANTLTVDTLSGPLIGTLGVVSAATTGDLTASSPLSVSQTRQLLGGAAALSIDTSNLQAVITTGVITVTSPLSTDNLAYAVGNSLLIGIDTSNLQAVITTGVVSVTSPLTTNNLAYTVGNSLLIGIDTSSLLAQITTGLVSATVPITVTGARYVLGGALAVDINTANMVPYVGATSDVNLGAFALSSTTITATTISANTYMATAISAGARLNVRAGYAVNLTAGAGAFSFIPTGMIHNSSGLNDGLWLGQQQGNYCTLGLNVYYDTSNNWNHLNIATSSLMMQLNSVNNRFEWLSSAASGGVILNWRIRAMLDSAGTFSATILSGNVVRAVGLTSTNFTLGTLSGPLIAAAGVVSAATTGNLTVTAPLQTDNTRQMLGGSVALSINTQSTLVISLITANNISLSSDIYNTPWTDYFSTSTIVGWSSKTGKIMYKKVGKLVFLNFAISGTSNSTSVSFTVPYTSDGQVTPDVYITVRDNNVYSGGVAELSGGSTTISCYKGGDYTAFTNTGTKDIRGQIFYEATA